VVKTDGWGSVSVLEKMEIIDQVSKSYYVESMENKSLNAYEGGCLCGAVRYKVDGEPSVVAHCHCESCQRGSGAGHSTGAVFPAVGVRLTGHVSEYKYTSDNGNEVTRVFCPECGSPILGHNSSTKGYVSITLGTIDDSSNLEPKVVVFARNRKPWDGLDQGLPTFEDQPNWKPEVDV